MASTKPATSRAYDYLAGFTHALVLILAALALAVWLHDEPWLVVTIGIAACAPITGTMAYLSRPKNTASGERGD